MILIDKYAYSNELRKYPAKYKLLLALTGLLLSRIIDNYYFDLFTVFYMGALVILVAKLPYKAYLKLLFIPASFLIISIITIVLSINDVNYLFSVNFLGLAIGVTADSLQRGGKLFTTVLASLTSIYFLILTTPMIDLIKLMKKARLPKLFIELMVLVYSSIFIFIEEANNIYFAQTMRFGYMNRKNMLNSTSLLIRNLFVRVFIKQREMNISLECKLYNGEFKIGD